MKFQLGVLFVALLSIAGCKSAIVGAECKAGFMRCDSECVDTAADFRNCGACGNDCGAFICELGMCSRTQVRPDSDAGFIDGGMSTLDSSFDPDPGLDGCGIGQTQCSNGCFDFIHDHEHCGDCGIACAGNEVCSAGTCKLACDPPLTFCGGNCIDRTDDPSNCGGCGTMCPSGVCEDGTCVGAVPGYAIAIGHDFVAGKVSVGMSRIAGNAVFLGNGDPVRVLVFRGEANASSVDGVEQAIDLVKEESGRDWEKIDAIESIVPVQLQTADVFLIHAQSKARKSTLAKLGKQWGNALAYFVATGGVIVLFEGPSATNDGTFRLLEPAKIFSAAGRDTIANQQLKVVTPGLGVAVRVPSRYLSANNTVRFRAVKSAGATVVADKNDDPVVVQRIIVP